MAHPVLTFIALIPIIFFLFMEYGMHWSQKHVIPPTCLLIAVLALAVWRVDIVQLFASFSQGFILGFQIIYVVLATIFLGRALIHAHVLARVRSWFERISPDRRIQAIIVGWFLGSTLDGVVGFSATSGITCGMLAGIGFPPACACLVTVLGVITSTSFCAAGFPMVLGVAEGLKDPNFLFRLDSAGITMDQYIRVISAHVGIVQGIAGTFTPLLMIMTMTRFFGKTRTWTEGLSIAPFALFCGLAFTVPYALTAIYLGPEFPDIIGGLVGLSIAVTAVKIGFLIPHDILTLPERPEWRKDWLAGKYSPQHPLPMPMWQIVFPFLVLALLVIGTRWNDLPFREWLQSYAIQQPQFLGTTVNLSIETLYHHGTIIFLMMAILAIVYHHVRDHLGAAVTPTVVITASMIMRLPLTIGMACMYLNSGVNNAHFPSMFQVIADGFAHLPGAQYLWPFLSPFIGGFLSFLFDTHVFSLSMASMFQHNLAEAIHLPGTLFIALSAIGASAGNLVTIHYLAGTLVTVGMIGWEHSSGRRLAIPMFVYLVLAGIVGLIAAHFFNFTDPLSAAFTP
ncbi:MAG: L-lactate permease [Verrucomicrobiota bacterium]